jgi:TATA-box binding protein (TBP) (component of TFIID and TFIIIB)
MKVVIENMIASCRLSGDMDMKKMEEALDGARYQPEVFNGMVISKKDPKADIFILNDGTIKLHGLTSEPKMKKVLEDLLSEMKEKEFKFRLSEPLRINEVIASFDMGSRIDPKEVYEEFKDDGVVYDPSELPGFILRVGSSGIEVLIFPEGKIITRGADNIPDAVSSLQIVENRISKRA